MKEVYRSSQKEVTLLHRIVKDDGKFIVEFPEVDKDDNILSWNAVGGGPGLPDPTYDTIGEAKAFIEGLEHGLQGEDIKITFRRRSEQRAYDEGLKFGLYL